MVTTEVAQQNIPPTMLVCKIALLELHFKTIYVNHLLKVALLETISMSLLIHAKAAISLVLLAH